MNNSFLTAILGAGGHAKVVLDALDSNGTNQDSIVVYDTSPHLINTLVFEKWRVQDQKHLDLKARLHIAIGDNKVRKALSIKHSKGLDDLVAIQHNKAIVSCTASISPGSFIAAGAVVAPHAKLGYGVIANHMSIIDHDCFIGNWVHIAPNATLGGQVIVHEGSMVGAGAVVLPGVIIGAYSIIGAGAVVTRDVPSKETVYGIPAKSANL
jgi:sugar O-acyltransferase (sialic acid O-acetyltransferase NeuD family)